MGNTCKGLGGEDDMEIYTGTGMYRFKKSRLPKNDDDTFYYGKDRNFDKDVQRKIHRTTSLVRDGAIGYRNGNVQVIIPCS